MATDKDRLTIRIGSREWGGWTTCEVTRSIEQAVSTFTCEATARYPDEADPIRIRPGQECKVYIGDDLVITGWVDRYSARHDARSREIAIAGRSKTSDIVDCSAVHPTSRIKRMRIDEIAATLAEPYNVTVAVADGVDPGAPLGIFALQPGETVFSAIERAARMRGLLLYDSPEGWLVLGRAGSSRAVDCVELGVNLLSGSLDHDVSGRFSEYRVRGQTYGTDLSYGETVAAVDGSATDDWVRRFRALILHAERSGTTADMRQRALWEAATRAGKSIRYTATVPGWRQNGNGPLWRPNSLAWIKDPWAGIDGELLIAEARCSLTGAGQVTQLSCCPREAYLLEPVKATNPTSGRKAAAKGVTWWSESPDEDEE